MLKVRWTNGKGKADCDEKQKDENLKCIDFRAYLNHKRVLRSC